MAGVASRHRARAGARAATCPRSAAAARSRELRLRRAISSGSSTLRDRAQPANAQPRRRPSRADRTTPAPVRSATGMSRRTLDSAGTDALRRLASELSGADALQPVFEEVLDNSERLFHADRAGLWLWHPTREHPLELVGRAAIPRRRSSAASAPRRTTRNLAGFEALRRETVIVFRDADDPRDHAGDARAVRGERHRVAVLRARRLPRRAASRCSSLYHNDAVRLDRRRRPRSPEASATPSRPPSATPGSWPPWRTSPRGSGRSRTCRCACSGIQDVRGHRRDDRGRGRVADRLRHGPRLPRRP